jgi:hypothetical protein
MDFVKFPIQRRILTGLKSVGSAVPQERASRMGNARNTCRDMRRLSPSTSARLPSREGCDSSVCQGQASMDSKSTRSSGK